MTKDFESEFLDRVRKIEHEALAMGSNITEVCRRAGVARATPDRWRRSTPTTVVLVKKMEETLAEMRAALPSAAASPTPN